MCLYSTVLLHIGTHLYVGKVHGLLNDGEVVMQAETFSVHRVIKRPSICLHELEEVMHVNVLHCLWAILPT